MRHARKKTQYEQRERAFRRTANRVIIGAMCLLLLSLRAEFLEVAHQGYVVTWHAGKVAFIPCDVTLIALLAAVGGYLCGVLANHPIRFGLKVRQSLSRAFTECDP
ncbi:hypothetical protein MAFF211479_49230 (plasmid) [Ralstonia solanacearum]|nr:hypothetical protein MAFF211479_49230 [Ralstonia solanacearum]BCM00325.1 hypothetical protein MAFF211491_47780 [Ralstonia solanacearum]BCM15887.1 hypothetical protein MAFF241648_50770 [Ralstonia solanacearum]BCN07788.1 hypothetical protein RPSB_49250 [Ralstonia solanacearum]BCN11873.1 hypothetical protein RPSD_37580 [Ralstonia solanacearum]